MDKTEIKKTETDMPAEKPTSTVLPTQNGETTNKKKMFMGVDLDIFPLNVKKAVIKEVINKVTPNATTEEKKERAQNLMKIFEKGMDPKELMGLSDTEVASIYSFAYSKLIKGKYEEAKELFKFLWSLEPNNYDFVISIGVCYHRLKDYAMASVYYMLADSIEPKDPLPYFYMYDCFMNLKHVESACIVLQAVIAKAGDRPEYIMMVERAKLLLESAEHQALLERGDIKPDKEKEA